MKKLMIILTIFLGGIVNAQTFDFSCDGPMDYIIAEFIEDSGRTDVRPTGRLLTRSQINELGISRYSNGIPNGVVAFAIPCSNDFVFVRERWDVNTNVSWRKKVVYHELGHAVFGYRHPTTPITCPSSAPEGATCLGVNEGFGNHLDIMGYNDMVAGDSNWKVALIRFFAGTDHTTYHCGSNKGGIIIDN